MQKAFSGLIVAALLGVSPRLVAQKWIDQSLATASAHYQNALSAQTDVTQYPRSYANGKVSTVSSSDWTSGFFPGSLWQLFKATGNPVFSQAAKQWQKGLEREQYNRGTHDLGFMMYCPFGEAYKVEPDTHIANLLVTSAASLASRYRERIGCIRSWDHTPRGMGWQFPVIVDNMMNLELLFWAAKQANNPQFEQIANRHAKTTLANHFRKNNSSFHVVDYDTGSGKVRWKGTLQGYANASAWARGQAWALYGYTVCYRFTKDTTYLNQAKRIADYMLTQRNMPKDLVPYWDYQAPEIPNEARDASAAAVAASGMLEMALYMGDAGHYYKNKATAILKSLSSMKYLAKPGTNGNFALMHSTGAAPFNSEVDVPLNYADYYYLEALNRLKTGKI